MDSYIDMLENRREQIKPRGWTIPDGVWEFFIETIKDCGIPPEHSDPSYVVDNLAVNGDYGPAENYLDIISIVELFEGETEDLEDLIEDAVEKEAQEYASRYGWFTYDEPDSDYNIGICVSL